MILTVILVKTELKASLKELNPTSITVNQTGYHMFLIFVVQKWFEYLTQTKLHEKEKSSIGNHIEDIIPDIG